MLTYGELFAGVGGFGLGLERAGMRCLWQCELDPFCIRVLEKHWPDVLRVRDVRDVGADTVPAPDVLAGGFPCQGVSDNGLRLGLADPRSGLWSEMFRVIRELRPRYVVVENVRALTSRGLDRVLGDLASIGYDAEWDCIPAAAVGAPHRRDRFWLVAYPASLEAGGPHPQADPLAAGRQARPLSGGRGERGGGGGWASPWAAEPDVGRVADGVPDGVDRLHALGNALVPQIAEWIGRRIVDYEEGELSDAA